MNTQKIQNHLEQLSMPDDTPKDDPLTEATKAVVQAFNSNSNHPSYYNQYNLLTTIKDLTGIIDSELNTLEKDIKTAETKKSRCTLI